jgi:hypothetical protein
MFVDKRSFESWHKAMGHLSSWARLSESLMQKLTENGGENNQRASDTCRVSKYQERQMFQSSESELKKKSHRNESVTGDLCRTEILHSTLLV